MKKLFCFLAIIATFGLINIPSFATEAPSYDSTYNSNTGAFFGMAEVKLYQILLVFLVVELVETMILHKLLWKVELFKI